MPESDTARVRTFNRFWTRTVGALDEGHLATDYSLTECRVLYELATAESVPVTEVRDRLGLDPGQLSRILARFDREGLTTLTRDAADARRRTAALTAAGRRVQDRHDALSDIAVRELLDRAAPARRPAVLAAMDTLRDALAPEGAADGAGPRRPPAVVVRAPRAGELGWIIGANARVYAREYGWNEEYEALVARIVADYAADHDPRREAAWIADLDGDPVGCVMCVADPADGDGTARLRLLLVDPRARGLGLGRRLVRECVAFARAAGYRELRLWTNSVLDRARRIYRAEGFTLVDSEPHRSFGADLTGQTWTLDLRDR